MCTIHSAFVILNASMNSRLIRILLVVIGVSIGLSATVYFKNVDRNIDVQRTAADTLRAQAASLTSTIADVRAGQVGYVARGQAEGFWISRVESLLPTLQSQAAEFAASLTSPAAQSAFEPATAALENFRTLDRRVREFVKGGNALFAADLIFSDGLESTATATAQVVAAMDQELQARSGGIAQLRSRQLTVLGGAAGTMFLLMIALALTGSAAPPRVEVAMAAPPVDPVKFEAPLPKAKAAVTPRLIRTAKLCGELSRVAESTELPNLLERAAKILDASGLIVWLADPSGRDLKLAMSYGYADQIVAKMGSIPREANNATAAAFRAREFRTVTGDAVSSGAVIVPLITSEGCVGVMSAEMRGGSEKDESSQALATILAAQLATLVASPAEPQRPSAATPFKAAAQG